MATAASVAGQAHNSLGAAFIRSKAVVVVAVAVVIVVFPFFLLFLLLLLLSLRCAHSHEERATFVAATTYAWLLSSALKESAREKSGCGCRCGCGRERIRYLCAHLNILCI